MTKTEATRVLNATVSIRGAAGTGQGVLVPGHFILTAAHCIKWSTDSGMAMGDYYCENITTPSGAHLRVGPSALDPVSDIAVLGSLDDQTFFEDWEKFEEWCESTRAVPLSNSTPRYRRPVPVHILTHKQKWIEAKIIRYASPGPLYSACMAIEADDRIEGGTSGGPVVDSHGRLVGIVSHSVEGPRGQKTMGALPIVHLALPRWILLMTKAGSKSCKLL